MTCAGAAGCDRLISISARRGGNEVAKGDPEGFASEWARCAGCGRFTCDRCVRAQAQRCACGAPVTLLDAAGRLEVAQSMSSGRAQPAASGASDAARGMAVLTQVLRELRAPFSGAWGMCFLYSLAGIAAGLLVLALARSLPDLVKIVGVVGLFTAPITLVVGVVMYVKARRNAADLERLLASPTSIASALVEAFRGHHLVLRDTRGLVVQLALPEGNEAGAAVVAHLRAIAPQARIEHRPFRASA